MATYGLSLEEITHIISNAIDQTPPDSAGGFSGVLGYTIRGIAEAIEQNNAKLAEQIIAELRGDDTPPPRG